MIAYVIVSFFLENTFSLLFSSSCFIPLFFLVSLITIYHVKEIDNRNYLICLLGLGIFYDMVYTNIYIDSILFPVLGYLNILFKKNINEKILLNSLFIVFAFSIYELLFYFLFCLLSLNNFNICLYLVTIIRVIPINLIYYFISLLLLKRLR